MKKILVLTASTSLPRSKPEILYYQQTWPYLFSPDYEVFQCSKGGATSDDLRGQTFYLNMFQPDIVVIQVGLVDCAPRAFSQREIAAFYYFWLTRYLVKILNKWFGKHLRNIRRKRNVSIKKYEQNIQDIKNAFTEHTQVYALGLFPPTQDLIALNKYIGVNANKYNQVINKVFGDKYICVDDMSEDLLMSDGQHPNQRGHKWLYDRIKLKLEEK